MLKFASGLFALLLSFCSFAQMDIYGTTTGTCDCYQLTDELPTQAGSIWSPNSIDLDNSFDLTFDISLGDIDAGGADGTVFVIRKFPGDPGGDGGGLGYSGIDNSIGVEIDTWHNAEYGDIPEDHIGMHSDGGINHDLIGAIELPNVEDGMSHIFRATWNPETFELEIFFDGASMFTYTGDMTTLFFEGDSEVFFGWTAGTGGAFNQQVICSYRNVDFTTDLTNDEGETNVCVGQEINFIDNSTSDLIYDSEDIIGWEWDFGDGGSSTDESPTHSYDAPGAYVVTLRVFDITGCFSEETIIVNVGGLSVDLVISTPTCFGFSDGSIVVDVPDGLDDPTFTITNADGDSVNEDNSNAANELPTGWYYIMVEDESGCSSALDSVFLTQPDELDADITVTDPLCYGFETGWARVDDVYNATGSADAISYFWAPNPAGNEGLGEDSTWALGAGTYVVTINDENGCSKAITFTIGEPDSMYFPEFGFEHAYCRLFNYQSGNGVVFGSAAGGTPDFDYIWTNLDNGETQVNSTWGGLNPGNYELTATDANGCVLTQTLFLDSLNPVADFTVISDQLNADCQGTATVNASFVNNSLYYANPNSSDTDTTFFWSLNTPQSGWVISHDINEIMDTVYTAQGETYFVDVCLVAINKNGCVDTTCKQLTIYEPISFTPTNIFTPNNDGVNDEFTFQYLAASIAEFNCVIVNRWGIVVAELNAITDGWDGTDLNGSKVKDGVYFYTYEAVTDNNTILKGQGNVQLVDGE